MTTTHGGPAAIWEESALGDLCRVVMGQSPPSSTYNSIGEGMSFLQGKADFGDIYPTPQTFCTKPVKLVKKGSVLISVRAPVGDVNIADRDYIIGRGLAGLDFAEGDNNFLFYLLKRHQERIASLGSGTTFQSINKETLVRFKVRIPPISQQRLVARVLQTVQKAKQTREHELVLERERKVTLRAFLLTHGTLGERTRGTSIGEIPQSWGIKALNEVADLYSGGTPSKSRADWWNGSIPWASTKDLKKPRLSDVTDHVTEEAVREGSRLAPAMSLFIGVRGMILAKEIPICLAEVPMAFNQDVKAAVPRKGINPEFLLYALNFRKDALNPHVGTSAHGTRRISSEIVASLELPIPPDVEQSQIAAILTACDRRISALERECKLLGELFFSLLEELMSGRIDLKMLAESGVPQ